LIGASAVASMVALSGLGCGDSGGPAADREADRSGFPDAADPGEAPTGADSELLSTQLDSFFQSGSPDRLLKSDSPRDAISDPAASFESGGGTVAGQRSVAQAGAATAGTGEPPVDDTVAGFPPRQDSILSESASDVAAVAQDPTASADVNRLLARLQELRRMQLDVQTVQDFQRIQEERVDKANQLLAAQPSFDYQVVAIKSQVEALSLLDGAQVSGARERLTDFCRDLLGSDNRDKQRMGMLGLTGVYMRRFYRDSSVGLQDLLHDIDQVTKTNYDDFELGGELAQAASSLFANGHRQEAIELMTLLADNLRQSQDIRVIGVVDSLVAQVAMAEVKLDRLIADQVANEEKNLPNLRAGMEQIIASGATVALYNEMTPWMRLFEQQACYRSADLVAEMLEAAFHQLPADQGNSEVLGALQSIRQRMGLIGRTLDWSQLVDLKGQPFDPGVLRDKVVLVTFFSATADEQDRRQLQFETRMYEELHSHGFTMVGFNMDDDPNAARDFFSARPPRWHCLRAATSGRLGYASRFAQQVVADQTPYRLLLDRQGRVVHVAVPIERLGKDVQKLLPSGPSGQAPQP